MKNRYWPIFILAGLLISGCPEQHSETSQKVPVQRNFLIITLDTLRAGHLSCYGYPRGISPVLDRFAQRGVIAESAICPAPFTNPSHASLFTGKYPWEHGCRSNYVPLPERMITLAEELKSEGYHTGAFISGSPLKAVVSGLQQGFDIYDDEMTKPVFEQRAILRAQDTGRQKDKASENTPIQVSVPYARRRGEETVERAISWLKTVKEPWFLWVHLYDVHGPYESPLPLADYYRSDLWNPPVSLKGIWVPAYQKKKGDDRADYVARYDACIRYVDWCTGEILRYLSSTGLEERSLQIILSDHGESLGEHHYGFDHGKWLYQPSLQVPMLAASPGLLEKNCISRHFVSIVDLKFEIREMLASRIHLFSKAAGNVEMRLPENQWRYAETKPKHDNEPGKRLYCAMNSDWKYIYSSDEKKSQWIHMVSNPGENPEAPLPLKLEYRASQVREMIEQNLKKAMKGKQVAGEVSPDERAVLRMLGYIED